MKHFIEYIQVYPVGYADPERLEQDPDYIPGEFGQVEDYEFKLPDNAPTVGDVIDGWVVVEVDDYQTQNANAHFHVAVCTLDGTLPDRRDWSNIEPKVLTIYLEGDDLVRNEDGSVLFDLSDRLLVKPTLCFKPIARPIAGYDLVAVA